MTKLILAAAAAALLIAGPALAETARAVDAAPTLTVSAKGVDFSNPAQVKHFYARLRGAVSTVCNSGSINFAREDAACARAVTAQAIKAADKPMLTALYDASGDNNHAFAGNDQ